ncbi:MAG: hypothetical protein JST51_19655 [Armatimonadetes bacterium]|nr:hypothetical protein [Armatimonadota bacterium]
MRGNGSNPNKSITWITRRDIFEYLDSWSEHWAGPDGELAFLRKLYPLHEMHSTDSRFPTAEGDIIQHTVNNDDWERNWVFSDDRFGLKAGSDEDFLTFIAATLHPANCRNVNVAQSHCEQFNELLRPDGWELYQRGEVSGRPKYHFRKMAPGVFVSTDIVQSDARRVYTFAPGMFKEPKRQPDSSLVSVMMDFRSEYKPVYEAIRTATTNCGYKCERADDIWNDSVIVQDIFELIFASKIVVVDFSSKNPNVMYETGIAHAFGKIVLPITQSINDVPFDLRHHRVLVYLNNEEGRRELITKLVSRIQSIN